MRLFKIFFGLWIFLTSLGVVYAQTMAIVTSKSDLTMREEPTTKSKKIGSISSGQKVEILEKTLVKMTIEGLEDNWYKIRSSGKDGFAFGGFLKVLSEGESEASNVGSKIGSSTSVTISDFQGTWEADGDAGQIFISLNDSEKFIVTSGEGASKIEAKLKDFNQVDGTVVLAMEIYEEGVEKPEISDWKISLIKNSKKQKQIEVVYGATGNSSDNKEIFTFVSTKKTNVFAWLDESVISDLKSKAEEKKSETLVFKGFYLGMPLNDSKVLIEFYLSDFQPKAIMEDNKTGKVCYCSNPFFGFIANADGRVIEMILGKKVLDVLFKSEKTPRKEFLQMFIDAYQIPQLLSEVNNFKVNDRNYGNQVQLVYRSEKGFQVKFYEDSNLSVDNKFELGLASKMFGVAVDYKEPGTLVIKEIEKLKDRAKNFD